MVEGVQRRQNTVSGGQVALGTSFEIHFGNMLSAGNDIADLLEDALGSMVPLKFVYLWREAPLCDLPCGCHVGVLYAPTSSPWHHVPHDDPAAFSSSDVLGHDPRLLC